MRRHGFTLIEMLVATAIFAVGFVAVFGLFLAGIRFRKMSEDLTRCSLASSSLVSEFAIDAGRETAAPCAPSLYEGDGFADTASTHDSDPDMLGRYRAQPGVFYRVEKATDLLGQDDPLTTVVRLKVLIVPWATADTTVSLTNIAKRLQIVDASGTLMTDPIAIGSDLARRGLAMRTDAVITRRPAWMP